MCMASPSGSLDTSANSHPPPQSFSFSTNPAFMASATTSFSDLLAFGDVELKNNMVSGNNQRLGLSERIAERSGSGVPKFKSIPPPSLPISPPAVSPSTYFAIPPGLSPAELLDSPVLLNPSYNILPSPTTGTYAAQAFNWMRDSDQNRQSLEQDKKLTSDFSFQQPTTSSAMLRSSNIALQSQQPWSFQEPSKQVNFSSGKSVIKHERSSSMQSFSPEISAIQTHTQANDGFQSDYGNQQQQYMSVREQKRSDDGYNWRKYGQKQVKGSENPRSYYKCTYPNCPTRKKVERSLDGQVTEIVYKGSHNHPKPKSTRRSSSSASSRYAIQAPTSSMNEIQDQSFASHGSGQMDSVATPENSSMSIGDDEFDSQKSKSGGDDFDEVEPEPKRWKTEGENEGMSAPGSRTVREPRVVVQTTSDIDILDDGYRWRKYGQKVVKGNPNPRSYYKCTYVGCPVRKHVERASHDLRAVITTYEGKHNHDVPAARGSGSGNHSVNRPLPENNNSNSIGKSNSSTAAMAIRPAAIHHHSNTSMANPLQNMRPPTTSEEETPFTFDMLLSPGSFGFSGLGNPLDSYGRQSSTDNVSYRAKEEPRDDMLLQPLRC